MFLVFQRFAAHLVHLSLIVKCHSRNVMVIKFPGGVLPAYGEAVTFLISHYFPSSYSYNKANLSLSKA